MESMRSRHPIFLGDSGPQTEVQPRRTGINQTGRTVIIGNPISYVVEPGRYYPFLSLRGDTDPLTQELEHRIRLGDVMGEEVPVNQEPAHQTAGFYQSIAAATTRGAVQRRPGATLADTTLMGGIEPLRAPAMPDPSGFWSGLPSDYGPGDV